MCKEIFIFTNFFSATPIGSPFFDDLKSGQSCEPPSSESMESGELITANQRKTKVTSTVKNYRKLLRSQHLPKVGARVHPDPGKKLQLNVAPSFLRIDTDKLEDRLNNCFAAL